MTCPICRDLERAYETALSEYIEARSSEWYFICPNVAARKNVDLESARCELEEHKPVCASTIGAVASGVDDSDSSHFFARNQLRSYRD
jgi:hypothetical protein